MTLSIHVSHMLRTSTFSHERINKFTVNNYFNHVSSDCYDDVRIPRFAWCQPLSGNKLRGSCHLWLRHTIGSVVGWDLCSEYRYEGCSKWIAYFYLQTSNFKLAQKYSFHALEVLPVARNAKFQPMYPLLEGVTVRWFGHSNKVLMNGRSKCLLWLVFPPSKECFQFRKQKEITWGKVWGIRGGGGAGAVRQNSYFFFLQKRRNYCGGKSWGIVM